MSILTLADHRHLVETGLATPPAPDGTIRVHKRCMNRFSDEEHSDLPLIQPSESAFATIPEIRISLATLEYLGFNSEKAREIWRKWQNWPSTPPHRETDPPSDDDSLDPITFIDFILGHVGPQAQDVYDDDDSPWFEYMARCGINGELQEAIMDPRFKNVRLTNSCLYWLRDAIEVRYLGLQAIEVASREREQALQRMRSRPGSHQQSTATSRQRNISGPLRDSVNISSHTALSNAAILAAQNAPGELTLFKGIIHERIRFREDNGRLDMICLSSRAQTDLFGLDSGFYFAVDRETAERYALWAKTKAASNLTVIIQIKIPNSAIETLPSNKVQRVYYDPTGNDRTWEELIFCGRNGRQLPRHLRRFDEADLLIGTIASRPNRYYQGLRSYEQIRRRDVFKKRSDGRPAVQYAMRVRWGLNFLEERCWGAPNMQMFPLTSQELRDSN
ncbi:uncharacterized protein UV8b_02371 [Ustilaginoidea virens]|uniref:Uncharacterized protein n=1 Tax=Ustilaginoidea virens TaxID=1159556 RepID=A0A8E5HMC9_USTVR|nr:uncharacterized protein UV8b_02371 [Ustilaginoidea virens]QUC18130.1 hypothetical protein UV8b_02371 [Ustilaginoidea virens]